ncbi:MAG TPA: questin oxidase family protein [Chlamydiales bacterium]|nr:questin oxidase family protein [Chlamydiales bacterium]
MSSHLSHHLLAAYFLGATPEILREAYKLHAGFQRKRFTSLGTIDENNWKDHLEDEKYAILTA